MIILSWFWNFSSILQQKASPKTFSNQTRCSAACYLVNTKFFEHWKFISNHRAKGIGDAWSQLVRLLNLLVYWQHLSTSQEHLSEGRHLRKENSLRPFATCNKKCLSFWVHVNCFIVSFWLGQNQRSSNQIWSLLASDQDLSICGGGQFPEQDCRRQRFCLPYRVDIHVTHCHVISLWGLIYIS
jgi:hypothetical protein